MYPTRGGVETRRFLLEKEALLRLDLGLSSLTHAPPTLYAGMNGCRYHLSCTLLIISQVLLELSTTKRSFGVYRMVHTLKPHIFVIVLARS
jgi:hypothetical protein